MIPLHISTIPIRFLDPAPSRPSLSASSPRSSPCPLEIAATIAQRPQALLIPNLIASLMGKPWENHGKMAVQWDLMGFYGSLWDWMGLNGIYATGNLLHSYWTWPRKVREFSHQTWWFSIVMLVYQKDPKGICPDGTVPRCSENYYAISAFARVCACYFDEHHYWKATRNGISLGLCVGGIPEFDNG